MEQVFLPVFMIKTGQWEGLGTRRGHDAMLQRHSCKYYKGLIQYFTDLHKTDGRTEYNSNKPAEWCKPTIDLLQYEYDYILPLACPSTYVIQTQ